VVLAPDGQHLFVLGGNHTKTPNPDSSALRLNYAEDQLLPRMTDARGHARSIRAPGGWVARTDKEGKSFHLYSAGFRNQYDVAFNPDGEMFTFDSDMEWDSGTPWYRPTRIYHVTSGSEFGWRTGTGKFPVWYPDVLPPTLDVGPGCPTGVVSGMGARFPAKYQDAIYAFDWTYGTIYAIHLTATGGSYAGTKEEFVTGVPLNVSDGVIGKDGNMYFAVGGRGTQSALYRVKYTGSELTKPSRRVDTASAIARAVRQEMEAFHGRQVAGAVARIWPNLGHADRSIRYASRVALEHQPVADWQVKALAEKDSQTALSALLALTRQGDPSLQAKLLAAFSRLKMTELSEAQKLEALRVLGLTFIRMGKPEAAIATKIAATLSPLYPAASDAMNRELVAMLVYLGAPDVVAKTVPLMSQDAAGLEEIEFDDRLLHRSKQYGGSFLNQKSNNPQRQQIWYAYALKNMAEGWTPALRRGFFTWFAKSRNFKGGASFGGFLENFRKESLGKIADAQIRAEMDSLSRKAVALVPAGYESARKINVGVKPGMKFDTEEIEAKAGEKIAIVLLNNDPTGLMHNLAVCAPGSQQKVMAATLAIGPKAIEQNFIPDIPEVLASTPQVAPNRKFVLYMTVPPQPGDYPYICTYPGHAQLMFGNLKVTK
ncbi:MAG: plastocyanin/azurin family copper-binding protein, partial [Verrucomicrobiales bacterium]